MCFAPKRKEDQNKSQGNRELYAALYMLDATNTSEYKRASTQSNNASLFREQSFRGKDDDSSIIVYNETTYQHHL